MFPTARSERYGHLGSDDDDETNDDESYAELRQFSSVAHRFSKVPITALVIYLRDGIICLILPWETKEEESSFTQAD